MISVAPYRWLERAGTAVGCRMAAVLSVLALAPSPAHSQWAVQDEMVAGGPAAVSYVGRAIGKVGVFCADGGVYAFVADFSRFPWSPRSRIPWNCASTRQ